MKFVKEENQMEVSYDVFFNKGTVNVITLKEQSLALVGTSHVPPSSCPLPCPSWWTLTSNAICCPAVAFSVVRQANWVNFCDLADVHWELRSGQAHFYVCPKPRFQLGERLWNLFPRVLPKLFSSFLQLPPWAEMIA